MRRTSLCGAACLLLAAFVAIPGSIQAQVRGPVRNELRSTLKSVDASASTISVMLQETRTEPAGEKTYPVAKDAEIGLADANNPRGVYTAGKLSDLVPGSLIGFTLAADGATVDGIVAEGPVVRGLLKRIDPKTRKVTVATQAGRGGGREAPTEEESSYYIGAKAEIGVDDGRGGRFSITRATLEDLAPGAQVTLRLSGDQKEAVELVGEATNQLGTIKSINPAAKTLTLTRGAGRGDDAVQESNLTVADDAILLQDDGKQRRLSVQATTLADIPVGAMVSVRLAADQQKVTMLRAEGPMMPAMIKSVNAGNSTITIAGRASRRDETPEEKTLAVARDARVIVDGNVKPLAEVPTGEGHYAMLKLSIDQKTVNFIQSGTVQARQ